MPGSEGGVAVGAYGIQFRARLRWFMGFHLFSSMLTLFISVHMLMTARGTEVESVGAGWMPKLFGIRLQYPSAHESAVSITIKLDLPADVAAKARAKGLLEPASVSRLIERELDLEEPL